MNLQERQMSVIREILVDFSLAAAAGGVGAFIGHEAAIAMEKICPPADKAFPRYRSNPGEHAKRKSRSEPEVR